MDQTLETLLNDMNQEIDQWMAFISDKMRIPTGPLAFMSGF
ncbi:hypothetical protein [Paenibacillus sp. MDMC362]|nr:hypothetical protein [Paenibacillus sp. MDMC362]